MICTLCNTEMLMIDELDADNNVIDSSTDIEPENPDVEFKQRFACTKCEARCVVIWEQHV